MQNCHGSMVPRPGTASETGQVAVTHLTRSNPVGPSFTSTVGAWCFVLLSRFFGAVTGACSWQVSCLLYARLCQARASVTSEGHVEEIPPSPPLLGMMEAARFTRCASGLGERRNDGIGQMFRVVNIEYNSHTHTRGQHRTSESTAVTLPHSDIQRSTP